MGHNGQTLAATFQLFVLLLDVGDAQLKFVGCTTDARQRFSPLLEAAPALVQLHLDMRRHGAIPRLDVAARTVPCRVKARKQHATELHHELRLRQTQGLSQPQILRVAALDGVQLVDKPRQVGTRHQHQAEPELGVQVSERARQHLPNFLGLLAGFHETLTQPSARRDKRLAGTELEHADLDVREKPIDLSLELIFRQPFKCRFEQA